MQSAPENPVTYPIAVQTAGQIAHIAFPVHLVQLSSKLQQWCTDTPTDAPWEPRAIPITLQYIHSKCDAERIFEDIVTFCEHYQNTPFLELPMPLEGSFESCVGAWYAQFMESCQESGLLIALMRTAHFLQIEPLVDLSSAYMASTTITENPQKLEDLFSLTPCFDEDAVQNIASHLKPQ